jgi:hypothetical protein
LQPCHSPEASTRPGALRPPTARPCSSARTTPPRTRRGSSPDEVALWGVSDTDDGALVGESVSPDGYGVRGTSPYIGVNAIGGEVGVYTVSDYGTGVEALTYDGVAVPRVHRGRGRHRPARRRPCQDFRWSGKVEFPPGAMRVTVADVPLEEQSLVLANLQQWVPGLHVEAAVADVPARSFTLYLNRKTPRPLVGGVVRDRCEHHENPPLPQERRRAR